MTRQPASALTLGQVGKYTTVYWKKRKGLGQATGMLTRVECEIDRTFVSFDGTPAPQYVEVVVYVDDIPVPCDEWEAAE